VDNCCCSLTLLDPHLPLSPAARMPRNGLSSFADTETSCTRNAAELRTRVSLSASCPPHRCYPALGKRRHTVSRQYLPRLSDPTESVTAPARAVSSRVRFNRAERTFHLPLVVRSMRRMRVRQYAFPHDDRTRTGAHIVKDPARRASGRCEFGTLVSARS
jgi:hypothetical protein